MALAHHRGASRIMKWYVVLEVVYRKYPPKIQTRVTRLDRSKENTWDFRLTDVHLEDSAYGHVNVFSREDAGRKNYQLTRGIRWPGSSVFLIYVDALTKKGAVQKALGHLVGGYKNGELLEECHHGNDAAAVKKQEVEHGGP